MKILALDPGISTGWCLIEDSRLLNCGTLNPNQVFQTPFPKADIVVIERTPVPTLGTMNRILRRVVTSLESRYPSAVFYQPGEWKPIMVKTTKPNPQMTKHAFDAYRLALYHMEQIWQKSQLPI